MDYLFLSPIFIAGYFVGSIPFGLILAKHFIKTDIRTIGSGNIGATNVLRTGNKKIAALTLLLDASKGTLPTLMFLLGIIDVGGGADHLGGSYWGHGWSSPVLLFAMLFGLGAILGHCFPIWLKFKGGKGVATTLGVLLTAVPYAGLASCAVWILTAKITKISSLSALVAIAIAPIITLFVYGSVPAVICALITLLVWIRHKDNIKRLLKGEETKIGEKTKDKSKGEVSEPISE